MTQETKDLLKNLADQFETESFCYEDPSQFLRWYNPQTNQKDAEYASFIAAMLSFGSRSQFIPKIKQILLLADKKNGISDWISEEKYIDDFPHGEKKFYRFYSYDDMQSFFRGLSLLHKNFGSLESAVRHILEKEKCELYETFAFLFSDVKIVPKGKNSANKRIHMFLRWMVRQNSCVDLGVWNWFPAEKLLIPLDVHVMEEGKNLNLIPQNAGASLKTAKMLTENLRQIWPDDPVKGDFALFGIGVMPQGQTLLNEPQGQT